MKKPLEAMAGPLMTFISPDEYLDKLTAYDVSDNPEYIGLAAPGAAADKAVWQIRKIAYSGGNAVSSRFASGSADFDKVWNDRAGYAYP